MLPMPGNENMDVNNENKEAAGLFKKILLREEGELDIAWLMLNGNAVKATEDPESGVQEIEREKWVEVCREYVGKQASFKKKCYLEGRYLGSFTLGKIFSNLKWLKKQEEGLFEEIFTVEFVGKILVIMTDIKKYCYEPSASPITKNIIRNEKKYIEWLRDNLHEKAFKRDFGKVLKECMERDHNLWISEYMKLWSQCFEVKITWLMEQKGYEWAWKKLMEEKSKWPFSWNEQAVKEIFDYVEWFKGMSSCWYIQSELDMPRFFLAECSKETLLVALKNNFFAKEDMEYFIKLALEEGQQGAVPMLILKKHGGLEE